MQDPLGPEAPDATWRVQATGIFLAAVGFYGVSQRVAMRHLLLWGVVPLHWFYLALLTAGLALWLGATPRSPFYYRDRHVGPGRVLRALLSLALWLFLVWLTLYR